MRGAAIIQLLALLQVAAAFQPQILQRHAFASKQNGDRQTRYMSQWEDEDDKSSSSTVKRSSFDEAGDSIKQQDDTDAMDDMGEFDANPAYKPDSVDRIRDAIRARADELGIEKQTVSPEAALEAEIRARERIAAAGDGMLDLSQIGSKGPSTAQDDVPSIFFDAETELDDDEQKMADPVGQMTIPDQVKAEWVAATWPTPGASLRQMILLITIVFATGYFVVELDTLLREAYTDIGFIPRPEDIVSGADNMILPEGWLNNMSEEDVLKFQNEIADTATGSPASSLPPPSMLDFSD